MATNFPNGLISMGIPVNGSGIPFTYGTVYFVDSDNGSDGNDGLTRTTAFKTLAYGYSKMTTNKDDVLILSGNSAHNLTAMLSISKSRCHFIGSGGFGRHYGPRTRVTMGVTTDTADVHMIKNTGIGNTFVGIKFANGNTLTQNTSCFGEGGEYATFMHCEFYDSTHMDSDTHAEMLLNGDSSQFYNCTFGSIADSVSGDKVRPAVICTNGGVSGSVSGGPARDILFDNCKFWKNAGGTTTAHIKVGSDNDLERFMEIKDCTFVANKLGSVPAVAVASATLTKSQIGLTGSTVSYNCTKIATATGVISGLPARVATATIGIQAT